MIYFHQRYDDIKHYIIAINDKVVPQNMPCPSIFSEFEILRFHELIIQSSWISIAKARVPLEEVFAADVSSSELGIPGWFGVGT